MEEKRPFIESSGNDQSWSQMLFQKLQRSRQNANQKAKERKKFFGAPQEFILHHNLSSFGLITVELKLNRSN